MIRWWSLDTVALMDFLGNAVELAMLGCQFVCILLAITNERVDPKLRVIACVCGAAFAVYMTFTVEQVGAEVRCLAPE
jgi:hypothetical protein